MRLPNPCGGLFSSCMQFWPQDHGNWLEPNSKILHTARCGRVSWALPKSEYVGILWILSLIGHIMPWSRLYPDFVLILSQFSMSNVCLTFVHQQSFQVANGEMTLLESAQTLSRDIRVLREHKDHKNRTQIRQKLDSERTFVGCKDIFGIKTGQCRTLFEY